MIINLFGGLRGPSILNYLNDQKRLLGGFINSLKHQKLGEEEIRRRIVEHATIPEIDIDINNKHVTYSNERQKYEKDFNKNVLVADFVQRVPFIGEKRILECCPVDERGNKIFHGGTNPRVVDIQENFIITEFEAWVGHKQQIKNVGEETLGGYYDNQREMNRSIQAWNQSLHTMTI